MRTVRAVAARRASWVAVFALLLAICSAAPVFADSPEKEGQEPLGPVPSSAELTEAVEGEVPGEIEPPLTDPSAAEGVQHKDLERGEALELLEGVFGAELDAPAGIFDELNVDKFLAPNVAVISAGEQPIGPTYPGAPAAAPYEEPTLMDSTIPLSTKNAEGNREAVNLDLETGAGGLHPVNPLVDVSIPGQLGEGIAVPGPGIEIELQGAPQERTPSKVEGSLAFYPNVADDTDFAIAPNPGGLETLTHLRSPDAPNEQTYNLSIPAGATVNAKGSGAEVVEGTEQLMTIAPPSAIDAAGDQVKAELAIDGTSLTVKVLPTAETQYPVLVDPLFQSFEWYAKKQAYELEWWNGESWGQKWEQHAWYGTAGLQTLTDEHMTAFVPYGSRGLDAYALSTTVPEAEEFWIYNIPRYHSDPEPPETFIYKMTTSDVAWRAESQQRSPYMYMGLWGPQTGWNAGLYTHEGLSGHGINNLPYVYTFENKLNVPDIKVAEVGLYSTETVSYGPVELFVGAATIELSEPASTVPKWGEIKPPAGWVNQGKAYINFKASDRGLGVRTVTASWEGTTPPTTWKTINDCTGVAKDPCPLTWSFMIGVEPANMPTGVNNVSLVAEDPVGHVSSVGHAQLAVDHTPPGVTVAGSATEQATLGTKRAAYTVKVSDTDGSAAQPQSGVAKVSIAVDGTVVKKAEPGCASENCTVPLEWQLESDQYAPGQHTITVTATDAVGLSMTKTVSIQLQSAPPPSVSLSGTMTEQASLGATRPRYRLGVKAVSEAEVEGGTAGGPTYSSSFGTAGTGNGQFAHPAGIAVDAKGNLWIVDENHYRVEKFNEAGEFLSTFGTQGTENGKFRRPTDVAVDAKGNLWVTDAGNNRIEEFNEKGEYLTKVGTYGTGNLQFNGPESIAIDAKGNIWVGDTYNGRLEELNEKGEFVRTAATRGSGVGQIGQSTGVAVGPGGNIWVADWENNRVEEFSETGTFIRQFGSTGTGNGQFKHADAIEVDSNGNVWVGDEGNARVQEFSQTGEYVAQFGTAGTGAGQFSFGWPMGITVDTRGHIWISDTGNNRVQKWTQGAIRSEIATEITFDGKQVSANQTSCSSSTCSLAPEWMLESSSYPTGPHTLVVKATDGLGRSTTKTLAVDLQRDTTKPTVEVSGELYEAPAGWVEQESYGFTLAGTDAGAGVTSLALKLDGQSVVSQTQSCVDGGCGETITKSVNMSSYAGGAHSAEVVVTDGAGNVATKNWTLNVDPEGHITASEAADTLEAADATAESSVVAPTSAVLEPGQIEQGQNPALSQAGSEIVSSGTADVTRMTTDPEDGFSIESPEGVTEITPVVSESSSSMAISEGVAGVSANIANQVDSVIRPEYNGVQTFQAIRSATSPETYSWEVHLAPKQSLRLANPAQAEVYYPDGTIAFLITAEAAHDATGQTVPTSLEVNGNILTLRVEFGSGTFVYPIVAGQGWETSYKVPVIVEGPEDETQIREREEREKAEREAAEAEEEALPPPPPGGHFTVSEAEALLRAGWVQEIIPAPAPSCCSGGASASSAQVRTVKPFKVCPGDNCGWWHVELKNPSYFYKLNSNKRLTAWWEPGTQVHSSWYYPWYYAPEINVEGNGCGFAGPSQVWQGEHRHLTIWGRYTIDVTAFFPSGDTLTKTRNLALQIWVWPNGDQQRVIKDWTPSTPIEEA